jgi:hypothetical protein
MKVYSSNFPVYRLGYSQDVMYNISIVNIIQNVLGIFMTDYARMRAALIFSQPIRGCIEECHDARREKQEICEA